MNLDIPLTKVRVDTRFLTAGEEPGLVDGYWYGVTIIPARIIGCHVTLMDGANWARLPFHALRSYDCSSSNIEITPAQAQLYDCFSYFGEAHRFNWLRGQPAELLDVKVRGYYLFTIDYFDPDGRCPFGEEPEQHKQHHILECEDGIFRARPNNFVKWTDTALYRPFEVRPPYRRQREVFSAE